MATYYSNYFVAYPTDATLFEDRSPRATLPGDTVSFKATVTLTAAIATGDVLRFLKVPKGAVLRNAEVTCTDFGTDVPGTLGWETTDVDCFDADVVFETAATVAVTDALLAAAPATSDEDYLSVTVGTVDTGAAGTATIIGSYVVP